MCHSEMVKGMSMSCTGFPLSLSRVSGPLVKVKIHSILVVQPSESSLIQPNK